MRIDPTALIRLRLFRHLPCAALSPLLARSEGVAVRRGDCVIQEGTPGRSAMLVVAGRLRVSAGNGRVHLGVSLPGDLVGERALLEPAPLRTATLCALEDSTLLVIDPATLRALSATPVAIAIELALIRGLTLHLRGSTRTLAAQPAVDSGRGTLQARIFEADTCALAEPATSRWQPRPGRLARAR